MNRSEHNNRSRRLKNTDFRSNYLDQSFHHRKLMYSNISLDLLNVRQFCNKIKSDLREMSKKHTWYSNLTSEDSTVATIGINHV